MKVQTSDGMAQTRRVFIGQGAFAFLAAAGMGHRAFGATGEARLRLGVLSDIHISKGKNTCDIFAKALAYFRDQKVDAVLIAGDMADTGLVSQLLRVGETWRRVFPGDKRPDGGHVEKIFVTGNHDCEGWRYGQAKKTIADAKEKYGDDILVQHLAEGWKRAFDEEYSPMYVKTVKGYKFVGVNFDPAGGYHKEGAIAAFLESHRNELAGQKPFFYTQHFHPKDTCCSWAWGMDNGYSTAALGAFPNAIAFSGHSHTPLTDDRTLWRGAFTSIGTASLRFLVLYGGRENSAIWGDKGNVTQQMPALTGRDAQHGQLVTVYDDRIVLERRDFANDLPAAPDWIVPLPAHASPFAERAETAPVPEFADGAKVEVERIKGKNRAKEETEQFVVSFPNVKGLTGGAHAFDFQVTVEAEDVDRSKIWATKRVYSPHFYWAAEKDDDTVTCVFACSDLPAPNNRIPVERGRRFRFAVAPANSFGVHGKAIRSEWLTGDFGKE